MKKTKCPYCNSGCDLCDNGFFETPLGDGAIFAEHCSNDECKFVNGIWVVREEQPLPDEERRCVLCNWTTYWQLYGWNAPDPRDTTERDDLV